MSKIDSVIFDLDGTLWDTCSSCAVAWNNVLGRLGIRFHEVTAEDVRKVTGKTHEACIRETFSDLSESQIQQLIEGTIKEDNLVIARLGGEIYDGVTTGLKSLSEKVPLFIVSNCQSGYIETFLSFSGFGELFKDFECWGNTGQSKSKNLASVIARNNLKNPIFLGDAEGDRVAARSCGIPFYFAEYGFGKVVDYDANFSRFADFSDYLISESLV